MQYLTEFSQNVSNIRLTYLNIKYRKEISLHALNGKYICKNEIGFTCFDLQQPPTRSEIKIFNNVPRKLD